MGVRVPDSFRTALKDGGTVTSADGKTVPAGTKDNLPVWGQPADWHDYTGKVGDATGFVMPGFLLHGVLRRQGVPD